MNMSVSSNRLPAPGVVVKFEASAAEKKQRHSTNKANYNQTMQLESSTILLVL